MLTPALAENIETYAACHECLCWWRIWQGGCCLNPLIQKNDACSSPRHAYHHCFLFNRKEMLLLFHALLLKEGESRCHSARKQGAMLLCLSLHSHHEGDENNTEAVGSLDTGTLPMLVNILRPVKCLHQVVVLQFWARALGTAVVSGFCVPVCIWETIQMRKQDWINPFIHWLQKCLEHFILLVLCISKGSTR